jgi:transposase
MEVLQMNRSVTMQNVRQILKLHYEDGMSNRKIAQTCSCSKTTVADVLARAEECHINWPLPPDMTDQELDIKIYPSVDPSKKKTLVDLAYVHMELGKKGVTRQLLWVEYCDNASNPMKYSMFCHLYREWKKKLNAVMRMQHKAGEKLYVDWAGMTVDIIDSKTGVTTKGYIFVAVLGASSYMYMEICSDMKLESWISCHVNAFNFFGGITEVLVPDNLRTGIKNSCFYQPLENATYKDMAEHYDTVIIPARVRRPRDKSKAEKGVQIVEYSVLAPLRNHKFFSVYEANQEAHTLMIKINEKEMKHIKKSRKQLFKEVDRPALKPLPFRPYEIVKFSKATISTDYHILVDNNYYSVPYQLIGKKVEIRYTSKTIEVFFKGQRVSSHVRRDSAYETYTHDYHMPEKHRHARQWPPEKFIDWAGKIGDNTKLFVRNLISKAKHYELAHRQLKGIMKLEKAYGSDRLEKSCCRALKYGVNDFRGIQNILKNNLDCLTETKAHSEPVIHENIRGKKYYQVIIGGNK